MGSGIWTWLRSGYIAAGDYNIRGNPDHYLNRQNLNHCESEEKTEHPR